MSNKAKRTNLKLFRVKQGLSQQQIADKIGVMRATYSAVELGKRDARDYFWQELQRAFNIPDADMWALKRKDGE